MPPSTDLPPSSDDFNGNFYNPSYFISSTTSSLTNAYVEENYLGRIGTPTSLATATDFINDVIIQGTATVNNLTVNGTFNMNDIVFGNATFETINVTGLATMDSIQCSNIEGTANLTACECTTLTATNGTCNSFLTCPGTSTLSTILTNNVDVSNQLSAGILTATSSFSSVLANVTTLNVSGLTTFNDAVSQVLSNNNTQYGNNTFNPDTQTGQNNVAIGVNSMQVNVSGNGNACLGYNTLCLNTSGSSNCVFGTGAGNTSTTSNKLCLFGASAGNSITTGINNICIGANAGTSNSPVTLTTQSNVMCLGNNTIASTYLTGNMTLSSPSSPYVLDTTNASIQLFPSPSTIYVGESSTNGSNNMTIYNTVNQILPNNNIQYGYNNYNPEQQTGQNNTAVGVNSMQENESGTANSCFGYNSLCLNTSGSSNCVFGTGAGNTSTTSNKLCLFGTSAGSSITTGINNICLGFNAGTSNSPITITSQSNMMCLGNNSITNCYIAGNQTASSPSTVYTMDSTNASVSMFPTPTTINLGNSATNFNILGLLSLLSPMQMNQQLGIFNSGTGYKSGAIYFIQPFQGNLKLVVAICAVASSMIGSCWTVNYTMPAPFQYANTGVSFIKLNNLNSTNDTNTTLCVNGSVLSLTVNANTVSNNIYLIMGI